MRILTVLISHNRQTLLQRTVESYRDTITGPHRLLVVDNASDLGTRVWLKRSGVECVYLRENKYPGYAANLGWERLLTKRMGANILLHRSDNDVEYQPGWCKEVRDRFAADPELGQLGLRTIEEEGDKGNVGGNSVIRRQVWDQGFRYSALPWNECAFEDGQFTSALLYGGWRWSRVSQPCIVHLGTNYAEDPDYYAETFAVRGIGPPPAA